MRRRGRDEANAIIGKVPIEQGDQCLRFAVFEIADQAAETDIARSDQELRRIGAEPIGAAHRDPRRAREPRCDRPVLLLRDSAHAAGGGDLPVGFARGRRIGGEKTRQGGGFSGDVGERGGRPVKQAGYDQSATHGSGTGGSAPSVACAPAYPAHGLWQTLAFAGTARMQSRGMFEAGEDDG